MTRQGVNIFAEALLESVQAVDFVLGTTTGFADDFARAFLSGDGEIAGLLFGFLLSLFDELLGQHDQGRYLFRS